MTRRATPTLLLASLALGLACSPASVAPPGADGGALDGAAADKACTDLAYAECTRRQACSPTYIQTQFGSGVTCQQVVLASCQAAMRAPSTGYGPAAAEACVQAIATWSCPDLLAFQNVPPGCLEGTTGGLAVGAPCGVRHQCQSGYCALAPGAACGTCQPPLQPGDSCASVNCPSTLSCTGTLTCARNALVGATCGASQPCNTGLTCVGATSKTTGVCQPAVGTAGAPCVFTGAGCDPLAGLSCNAVTGTCETELVNLPGQACGVVDGQQAQCLAGGCVRGACQHQGGPGEPCTVGVPPGCMSGLRCDATSDAGVAGICLTQGAVACP